MIMCLTLCVPALAVEGATPRMRNQDFSTSPPRGTQAYAYNIYMSTGYGNVKLEKMITTVTVAGLGALLGGKMALFLGADAALFAGGTIGGLFSFAADELKSVAASHAPSDTVGYIIDRYGYNGQEPPLEHYYKYVVHYYPYSVSSSSGRPAGGTTVTFYEYNWFS